MSVDIGLSLICTDPKYHRRGAAKALITPMLALADARGLTTYVEATPTGRPLYEKLGFRQVDSIDIDLTEHTKDQKMWYQLAIMLRQPQGLP
jgi:predicted acetyltransferase